ncbi:hypothetical protein FKP32DRAFT_1673985 [Trametes sanguinea]|nr:hypothetical protein FKP32DRAFT_1673985 [Trametes sanguinea]
MTTVPPPRPTSSPRWDSRNEGFVSPARLQQWKQENERTHTFSSTPSQIQQPPAGSEHPPSAPGDRPNNGRRITDVYPNAPSPAKPQHRSKPSFSAFFSRKSSQQDDTPQSPPAAQRQPAEPVGSEADAPQPRPEPPLPLSPQRAPSHDDSSVATSPRVLQKEPPLTRSQTNMPPPAPIPPLHPEIRSVVTLTLAHAHKVYFSGPLVRRYERQPDGQKPSKDEGWREVWAQLGGTTLSVWDMAEIREASKQGKQVPPTYINVTDAFVHVLGSVALPSTPGAPPKRYTNVLTLNTAGSNLYLFSCPSAEALVQWTAAFRLSAWEKSRLEEIYTAHLIRITLNDGRSTPSPLMSGRLEGWVRVRVAGQTDWKRLWMVITAGTNTGHPEHGSISSTGHDRPESPTAPRKKRMSHLFSREKSPTRSHLPARPMIQLFASSRPKDKKKALLTMRSITQAFAVYPERPELISRSTLMKLEGALGDEDMAGALKLREAWLLIMPELEGQNMRASEMLRWIIAIHDAFELYGRPRMYSWDPRDPKSMMFAYPIGPNRDLLFLDREFAETLDPRDDRTSIIRSQLQRILLDRMNGVGPDGPTGPAVPPVNNGPPSLPPVPHVAADEPPDEPEAGPSQQPASNGGMSLQLPPLSFDTTPMHDEKPAAQQEDDRRPLTPITERSVPLEAASRSLSGEKSQENKTQPSSSPPHPTIPEEPSRSILDLPLVTSPTATSPPPESTFSGRRSVDSLAQGSTSRPDSKLSHRPGQIASAPSRSSSGHPGSPPMPSENVRAVQSPEPRSPTPPRFQSPRALSPPRTSSPLRAASPPQSQPPPQPQAQSPPPVPPTPDTPSSVRIVPPRSMSQSSIPTSMYTIATPSSRASHAGLDQAKDKPAPPLPSIPSQSPPAVPRKNSADTEDILGDAGAALFYMQHMQQQQQQQGGGGSSTLAAIRKRGPPPEAPPSEDEDETPSESDSEPYTPPPRAATSPLRVRQTSPPPIAKDHAPPAVPAKLPRQPTSDQHSAVSPPTPPAEAPAPVSRPSGLRNKPSGARAAPASSSTRMSASLQNSFHPDQAPAETAESATTTTTTTDKSDNDMAAAVQDPVPAHDHSFDDPAADALAALSFLEREEQPAPPAAPQSPSQRSAVGASRSPSVPEVIETPASPSQSRPAPSEPRSSFAPSRLAAERKAKTQAQQAAHQAAVLRPGKANGRKGKPRDSSAWGESSEEEEEEEEEDDDDVDSDDEPAPRTRTTSVSDQASALGHGAPPSVRSPYGQANSASPARSQVDVNNGGPYPGQPRRPRDLPQLPDQEGYLGAQPQPRRFVSDTYTEGGRRSMYPESLSRQASPSFNQSSGRPASQYPSATPAALLQPPSRPIWSQVLDADRQVDPTANNNRDTFIQIEAPAAAMTKAFTPHGLLSAGLQDKQDRSAKRQEELARETGASLINVPNKPPPPQTGLLGAVTAHERERKREGGLGAALTEREREKRLAEERQRKLDELQRQQLDQMQQGGSMYGGMGMAPMGFNPMMANPMMMGMNPMMTGGWGYPGMMPGFAPNPQQLFAAQQAAAQAYQQAMVAMSTAGSQIGGDGGGNPGALNPMMTGGSMGMGGFDPRMSMMGMPMMNTGMSGMGMGGMNPGMGGLNPNMTGMGGMNPAMGMGGMGMNPMMGGMGMQMTGGGMGMHMTGGSQFDPRFSPTGEGAPRQQGDSNASRQFSSHPSSPGPQGSPAGPRPAESSDGSQNPSGPSSSNAQS